jgi:hypothetical protein
MLGYSTPERLPFCRHCQQRLLLHFAADVPDAVGCDHYESHPTPKNSLSYGARNNPSEY